MRRTAAEPTVELSPGERLVPFQSPGAVRPARRAHSTAVRFSSLPREFASYDVKKPFVPKY